jgi:exosortase
VTIVVLGALVASFALLYRDVFVVLVRDWVSDDYSHGFLIVPLALYFVWERRASLTAVSLGPSNWGLALALGSLALLFVGVLGAETFPARLSIVTTIAAAVLFIMGPVHLRLLAFPLLFLLLMIPIPALVFNEVAFPLQLIASRLGMSVLSLFHVPAYREGNIIVLASTTLEVAEACSGIRSLVSLVVLSLVYGYFTDSRTTVRCFFVAVAVPIAIGANALRVAGTGLAADAIGPEAALGFFHTFSGWLVFLLATLMLLLVQRLIAFVAPGQRPAQPGSR